MAPTRALDARGTPRTARARSVGLRPIAWLLLALPACTRGAPPAGFPSRPPLAAPATDVPALTADAADGATAAADPLRTFASEGELQGFIRGELDESYRRAEYQTEYYARAAVARASVVRSGPSSVVADPSITSNQVASVDEGDIVKARGDVLVVLRRGRIFSVRVRPSGLEPASVIDAYEPRAEPPDAWYDEILLRGADLVGIGVRTDGATEVNRFRLGDDGALAWRDTLLVLAQDYYSSRDYASRLVGDTLVLYVPVPLWDDDFGGALRVSLPATRDSRDHLWTDRVALSDLYRPADPASVATTTHALYFCDVSAPRLRCRGRGVVGASGRTLHVSATAAYLWVSTGYGVADTRAPPNTLRRVRPGAVLYRFPLDGGPAGAVRVEGGPTDQFSFDERAGELRVLVGSRHRGDGMWNAERSRGELALLRVPLDRFGAAAPRMPREAYAPLPSEGDELPLQNRFVGDHLLYGSGTSWGRAEPGAHATLFVHDLASSATARIELPYGVDRIEALDRDAAVIGSDGRDLHFASIALAPRPALVDTYVRPGASQAETRSHGFFFRRDGERRGVLGLPLLRGRAAGWHQLDTQASEVTFLRVDGLRLRPLGSLATSGARDDRDDRCRASCVDWYGNSRPIFWGDRVLALMGYELVEGTLRGAGVVERTRTDFLRALWPQITARETR